MFTHARCGGVLIPIAAPEWAPRKEFGQGTVPPPEYARCERCGLPGQIVTPPSEDDRDK